MKRKKTNPNRIPISPKNYDLEKLKQQATNGKVLQTWAVLLAALSNLGGMTTERLLNIWQQIDQAPTQIYSCTSPVAPYQSNNDRLHQTVGIATRVAIR